MNRLAKEVGALHFVGIGGIGMSGIAEVLVMIGYTVQGSDLKDSANVTRLREKGVEIAIGHDAKNIMSKSGDLPSAVVISSAVSQDNVELTAAREAKVPVIRRAEMLAELMRLKTAIAIGGTHGKTTTTSMVGQMLDTAGFDPTVINGGIVNAFGSNTRLGESDWMVVEADESDGTFTRLPASVVAVTNMDAEHMEHYGSFDAVRAAYRQFIMNIPYYGYAVMCTDHAEVQALVPRVSDRKIITYGYNKQADVQASNVRIDKNGSTFDVKFADWLFEDDSKHANGLALKDVYLPMLGEHNVQNCLVALTVAQQMGVEPPIMRKALENFNGVKRRFTQTGEVNGITVIDDYAHHPIEIETVLKTARAAVADIGGKVVVVMQPHRYSRLEDLFDEFSACFHDADSVLIADVYEAGEEPIEGINRNALVESATKRGHKDVAALQSREVLAKAVADRADEGDFVILMGAGDITAWAYALPEIGRAHV